jgi:predicted ATPase
MITRLQVRGFKSLLDVDVTLGPLTVFVGANGSGKTSVLEAIDLLQDAVFWDPREEDEAADELQTSYRSRNLSQVLCRQGAEAIEITAHMTVAGVDGLFDVKFKQRSFELSVHQGNEVSKKTERLDEILPWGHVAAFNIDLYRLDAESMAEAVYSDETEPELNFDGQNLAAVLDALQGDARERFDEIERRMREFVPMLRRLRVKRARARAPREWNDDRYVRRQKKEPSLHVTGHQVAFDFENALDISAEDASEGTLLLLGLLTIIESKPPGDMTIMLDDLDRALHPKAQRELVGYLHELVRSRPGLQIIATTHSPYLVEHLEYEEVRAITQSPDGTSVVASLADHPQAERWREEMSAGEFWSTVGENWITAGRK